MFLVISELCIFSMKESDMSFVLVLAFNHHFQNDNKILKKLQTAQESIHKKGIEVLSLHWCLLIFGVKGN